MKVEQFHPSVDSVGRSQRKTYMPSESYASSLKLHQRVTTSVQNDFLCLWGTIGFDKRAVLAALKMIHKMTPFLQGFTTQG